MGNRSAPSTKQINKHLNSPGPAAPKTGGASNGVGRIEKQKGK